MLGEVGPDPVKERIAGGKHNAVLVRGARLEFIQQLLKIILENEAYARGRGKVAKMTLPAGEEVRAVYALDQFQSQSRLPVAAEANDINIPHGVRAQCVQRN